MNLNIFERMTAKCPNEDCHIKRLGREWNLMECAPTYDRHGNINGDTSDSGAVTEHYCCLTCGSGWTVTSRGDERPAIIGKHVPDRSLGENLIQA